MKKIIKYSLIYIIMIIFFIITLYSVSIISNEKIEKNVEKSSETLTKEGIGLIIKNCENDLYLDNYTDALMINTVYSIDEENSMESIILARRSYNKNSILEKSNNNKNEDTINELKLRVKNENIKYYTYGRYWHGYITYLKPLLMFFDYSTIRIIFIIILNLLGIIFIYLIYKKYNKIIAIIIGISLLIIGYQSSGLSLTYFSVLAISIITSIYITLKKDIRIESFFIIGGLTSFFDLLTFPILTLGMPLITYLIVNKEKLTYKKMALMSLNWILGYGMIWASKWLISDIFFNQNIIKEAIGIIGEKTSNIVYDEKINIFKTIFYNISWISFEFIMIILVTIGIILVAKKSGIKIMNKETKQYILISLLPIIWYILAQNHSYIHCKYTYKSLILTLISLGIIDYKILKKEIKLKRKEEIK